ncbi:PIN-like domain-containing protein [Listeria booriae]|uniref:PIN like domain-containing protein n=1 Tax=Listeria booriae TaxID=1552123 RepID=A0A841XM41_9LIST|nr:PIN-like domain-containing protein [Listeria booriae]MBC1286996.1 hypothetical protein [Listeria booriae]MBC2242371.1 hypothetical protein [Listeria booriae]
MKNEFKEFYTNKIDISNPDESVLLVLDTNVLLNIYRFSEVTRTVFLDSLTKLKDNLFIPYQIGLEYNLNRQDAISKSKNAKNDLYSELDKIATKFANEIRMQIDKVSVKSTDYTVERNKIKNKLEDKTKSLIEKLKKNELNDLFGLLDTETDMSYRLAEILEGKVGPSYNQSELNDIEEKGKKRYECKIPPGFGDLANKKDKITYYNNLEIKKEYGDLIIWYQILEKAKEDQIKSVIFVSDDSQKNDWTYKQKGARAELKKEMLETSNAEFVILGSNQFIEQANPGKYDDLVDTTVNVEEYNDYLETANSFIIDNYFAKNEDLNSEKLHMSNKTFHLPESDLINKKIIELTSKYNGRVEYMQDKMDYIEYLLGDVSYENKINVSDKEEIYILQVRMHSLIKRIKKALNDWENERLLTNYEELENRIDYYYTKFKNAYKKIMSYL